MTKYKAIKTECAQGHSHPSKSEAARCDWLTEAEAKGQISHLEQQPVYPITLNGKPICKVILDFRYLIAGVLVVEDVKGKDNAISMLKRKLVEAAYPDITVTLFPPKLRKKRKAKLTQLVGK